MLEAQVDYGEYEQQLQMTFVGAVGNVATMQPCNIPFDLQEYPHICGFSDNMRAAREKADPGDAAVMADDFLPPLDPVYEQKQSKEI